MDECRARLDAFAKVVSSFIREVSAKIDNNIPPSLADRRVMQGLKSIFPELRRVLSEGECDQGLVEAAEEIIRGTSLYPAYELYVEMLLEANEGSGSRGLALTGEDDLDNTETLLNEALEKLGERE